MFWFWNRGEKKKTSDGFQNNQPNTKKKACSSAPFCNTSENENVGKWKREGFQCQLIWEQFSLGLQTICKAGECCFCVRKIPSLSSFWILKGKVFVALTTQEGIIAQSWAQLRK